MAIRIIIADDHQVFIDGIKALLKEFESIDVVGEALNGEQLIRQVENLKPDVVLTDVQMPVMDGTEATRHILKKLPATRIIALTMLNDSFSIKKMLSAGVYGYVLKTADKEELVTAIKKAAAGEKHFSREVTEQVMHNFSSKASQQEVLTKREKEILVLIAQGLTDKEIAEKVFLSPLTIITHRKNILSKLGLKNKVELTRYAIDNNLLP